MATVPEDYITEHWRSVVRFLWAKGLSAKGGRKEMVPIYGGSVCHVKRFTSGW
jgi:hypothetical protein